MRVIRTGVPEDAIAQLTDDYGLIGGKFVKKTKQPDGLYTVEYDLPDDTVAVSADHAEDLGATPSPSGSVATSGPAADTEATGLDIATDSTPWASKIADAGFSFVIRYYRHPNSKYPPLSLGEAQALTAAGLQIAVIWEWAGDDPSTFSFANGVLEGTAAYQQAVKIGQPPNTPIYFAVDYDATQNEANGNITDYFHGVAKGFATVSRDSPIYGIGVYGSGRVCRLLLTNKSATFAWVALSTGWAEFGIFKDWQIKQGPRSSAIQVDNDTDTGRGNFGAFSIP